MKRGVVFGRELEMAGSVLTLRIFREQFDEPLPAFLYQQAYKEPLDPEEFLRIGWAMCKTYDPDVQDYEDWLDEFPDETFNLGEGTKGCISVIDSAITAELFCEKTSLSRRIRKFVGRILGRIQRWLEQ